MQVPQPRFPRRIAALREAALTSKETPWPRPEYLTC